MNQEMEQAAAMRRKQTPSLTQTVSIHSIHTQRDIYLNKPDYQRSKVWDKKKKQHLIQSILLGSYIPPVVVFPDALRGNMLLSILDGQQRMSAIVDFIDNRFATGKSKLNEPGLGFLYPGRFFRELPQEAKDQILGYQLTFSVLQTTEDALLRYVYRSLQNLTQLTSGETLRSYASYAEQLATEIAEHDFFSRIYTGKDDRQQSFTMAFYPLGIEDAGGLVHLDKTKLSSIAMGRYDERLNEAIKLRVLDNLTYCLFAFDGIQTKVKTSVILMYQAIYFLDFCGYNLNAPETGVLSEWFLRESADGANYGTVLSQLPKYAFQNDYWLSRLRDLVAVPGLVTTNQEESKAQVERLISWIHHRHICPGCKKSVQISQLRRHSFRPGDALRGRCAASIDEERITIQRISPLALPAAALQMAPFAVGQ